MTMDIIRFEEPSYVNETPLKSGHVLGKGTYGSVSLERHPSSYQIYAKKTSTLKRKELLAKELRIMLTFRSHPRIIQASRDCLYMLDKDCFICMEYASKGTLHDVISRHKTSLPENVIGRATRMILEGLEALHSNGYIHCDLKPANVLLFPSTDFREFWDIKLADFGLSKEPNRDTKSSSVGTRLYMPPESFEDPDSVVGPAFDIWSLGCMVYEMYGGKPIKKDSGFYEWKLSHDISPVTMDFLKRCHAWDPSMRASATELLNHTFIKQWFFSVPRPIQPPSPVRQQGFNRSLFTERALPTPLGPPTRRHQEVAPWLLFPKAKASLLKYESTTERSLDDIIEDLVNLLTTYRRAT